MPEVMVIESITRRSGGSDHRMNGKTYHFRPATEEANAPHLAPVADMEDFQGFMAIKHGFRIYQGNAKLPEAAGVTLDRATAENQAAQAPAPEPDGAEQPPAAPQGPEPTWPEDNANPAVPDPSDGPEPAAPAESPVAMSQEVKDMLLEMDQEGLIAWAGQNAPEAKINRNMKPETMVAHIESALNG